MTQTSFRILSLDGGGVRGFLGALVLRNIEAYLNRTRKTELPIGAYFDLITGTSTGAIIGLAIAAGMHAKDVAIFYEENIPKIFRSSWLQQITRLFRPKYDSNNLSTCLKDFFGELTLADLKTDACIVCTSLQNAKPRLYKTDYLNRNAGRLDEKIADIALASAAAPTYFRAHSLKHSTNLIDGGLCANNPSVVGIIEGLQFERASRRGTQKPNSPQDIVLLSIGTGEQCGMPYKIDSVREGGAWQWLKVPSTPLLEVVFQSQSQLVHFQSQFLLGERYIRVNPLLKFPMQLDDVDNFLEMKNLGDLTREVEASVARFLV